MGEPDPLSAEGDQPVQRGGIGPQRRRPEQESLLAGELVPARETVLLNAAAALVADGTLPGTGQGSLVERLRAGLRLAGESVDSGAALDVLERWRAASAAS